MTGDSEFIWPCCTGAEAPVVEVPLILLESFAEEDWVLVALAYDGLGSCAGTAGRGDDFPEAFCEAALTGVAALSKFWVGGIALVIRLRSSDSGRMFS